LEQTFHTKLHAMSSATVPCLVSFATSAVQTQTSPQNLAKTLQFG